jgi:hypothetical protein
MLQTFKDINAFDSLVDVLESIESILKYLDIYTKVPHTAAITKTVVKTLVELLSILGLVTKFVKQRQPGECPLARIYLTQCNPGAFTRKLYRGNFDEMVLERLDRLTPYEGRVTVLQIAQIVYGLIRKMRVVMDGKQTKWAHRLLASISFRFRRQVDYRRFGHLACPGYVSSYQ